MADERPDMDRCGLNRLAEILLCSIIAVPRTRGAESVLLDTPRSPHAVPGTPWGRSTRNASSEMARPVADVQYLFSRQRPQCFEDGSNDLISDGGQMLI